MRYSWITIRFLTATSTHRSSPQRCPVCACTKRPPQPKFPRAFWTPRSCWSTSCGSTENASSPRRGCAVCNVRGYCTPSVVQHVWAMILGLTQHVAEYRRLALDGSWAGSAQFTVHAQPIRELAGRTFGVVGWGELGRAVAGVAEGFGMRVKLAN